MDKLIIILMITFVGLILFALLRTVWKLFWKINKQRKTWLWYTYDYLSFYLYFKFRWIVFGAASMPEKNAKILLYNFQDPKGQSSKHLYAKRAANVIKKYIEDVF